MNDSHRVSGASERFTRRSGVVFAAALLFALPAGAQQPVPVMDELPVRSIGPAVMAGRVTELAVVPGRSHEFYAATASGGVFRTRNNGVTWDSIFDDYGTTSVGAIALAPSDPATVWVGTGEPTNRQSSAFGNGVYLSFDGGDSFRSVGLRQSEHIGRIVVDPERPLRAFVAALGPLWRSGGERGVFRTEDGGETWQNVLQISADTGVVDLEMDPVNPAILYAAAYTRRRQPWGFNGGGPGSGIYRSRDGGTSWERLENGLPAGMLGRIGIEIAESDPLSVFALVEHATESGLYRSRDRGGSWTRVSDLNPRPMYYSHVEVDPNDIRRVYVLGAPLYESQDEGVTFRVNRDMTPTYDIGVHGDHHSLWIDPDVAGHLLLGGDGGIYESWDRGVNWRKMNNIPLTQYYAISLDNEVPYNIYGGAQDTHSWVGPSATYRQAGILNADWKQTNFGDGLDQEAVPDESGIALVSSQNGGIVRLDTATGNRTPIRPFPEEDENRYRFHWLSPIAISPHTAGRVYFGGNRLFISDDLGSDWRATTDLTRQEDRSELEILGVLPAQGMLSMHDGVSDWGTITTLAESPLVEGLLYVGTDDGRVAVSHDAGETWEFVDGALGFRNRRFGIARITASQHDEDRVYVAVDRHQVGDFSPLLYVSEDRGVRFRRIGERLPPGWINDIVEHPEGPNFLVVGTEVGAFWSFDRGARWTRVGGGLPHVPVDDVEIHPRDRDIVFGTHGRSIYILDDGAPLARKDPRAAGPELFAPRPAHVFLPWKDESYEGQARYAGENPPYGALLTVHLPDGLDESPSLEIQDGDGVGLARLRVELRPGFQRIVWNLRPGTAGAEGDGGICQLPAPQVAAGTYDVVLRTGGGEDEGAEAAAEPITVPIEVRLAPNTGVTEAQYAERTVFLNEVHAAISTACQVSAALGTPSGLTEEQDRALRDLRGGGGFRNPSALSLLARLYGEFTGDRVRQGTLHPPTPVHRRRLQSLRTRLQEAAALLGAN